MSVSPLCIRKSFIIFLLISQGQLLKEYLGILFSLVINLDMNNLIQNMVRNLWLFKIIFIILKAVKVCC